MVEINLPLPGKFNIYNYLIAYIIAVLIGMKSENILLVTSYLKSPGGRYQIFKHDDSTVIVDNANNEQRIYNIALKAKKFTKGRIIILYGGNGDTSKEDLHILGKLILELSDFAIITINNPNREKPENITQNMTADLDESKFEIVLDRKEAIKKGISMLMPGDTLLVLGRGDDNYQIIDSEKLPFNDINEVSKYTKNK